MLRYGGEDHEREPRQGVIWDLILIRMSEGVIMLAKSIATGSGLQVSTWCARILSLSFIRAP